MVDDVWHSHVTSANDADISRRTGRVQAPWKNCAHVIASLEIDLGAIRRNAAAFHASVTPARLWPVVKANAYGHGLPEIGGTLNGIADGLCVYAVEEGCALRKAGVSLPILVMGPTRPADIEIAHAADLHLTLWGTGAYRRDIAAVARRQGKPFPVHVKIDTGVTRFGLDIRQAVPALSELLADSDITVRGVFTHLAAVEEFALDFTLEQLRRFHEVLTPQEKLLRERGIARHTAASAAAILFPEARLDLVRPGIGIYGLWPIPPSQSGTGDDFRLEPALAWRTELAAVREVEAGRSVGYGCTYHTTRPSRIGIVPIGYAEGIPRAASGIGAMLIAGKRAPIIGRVCMNVTMLDITEIPQAHSGSSVTLIGHCGNAYLGADDWATWCGTIHYEIVARLPRDITRHYF
jgi:alanine racemase